MRVQTHNGKYSVVFRFHNCVFLVEDYPVHCRTFKISDPSRWIPIANSHTINVPTHFQRFWRTVLSMVRNPGFNMVYIIWWQDFLIPTCFFESGSLEFLQILWANILWTHFFSAWVNKNWFLMWVILVSDIVLTVSHPPVYIYLSFNFCYLSNNSSGTLLHISTLPSYFSLPMSSLGLFLLT